MRVRDNSNEMIGRYPFMPWVGGMDWVYTNAHFKWEREQMSIGLGRGAALDIFNDNIRSFQIYLGGIS